jgi:hypothetical protein
MRKDRWIVAPSDSQTQILPSMRPKPWQHWMIPGVLLVVIVAFAAGGFVGYGLGKDRAARGSTDHVGWLLSSAQVEGAATPASPATVFLFWDIAQTPHTLQADWYILNPVSKVHPLIADIKVDAASDGQGGITIIEHAPTGDVVVTGTLSGSTLTVVVPPNSRLFLIAPNAFVTLTFAPSTTSTFNQLVAGS